MPAKVSHSHNQHTDRWRDVRAQALNAPHKHILSPSLPLSFIYTHGSYEHEYMHAASYACDQA